MIEYKALLGTSSLSAYTLAATMALGATTMSVTIPQQSTDNKSSSNNSLLEDYGTSISTTFNQYQNRFIDENKNFYENVSKFYENLVSLQEELGTEFSSVLYDNLWDLYES